MKKFNLIKFPGINRFENMMCIRLWQYVLSYEIFKYDAIASLPANSAIIFIHVLNNWPFGYAFQLTASTILVS